MSRCATAGPHRIFCSCLIPLRVANGSSGYWWSYRPARCSQRPLDALTPPGRAARTEFPPDPMRCMTWALFCRPPKAARVIREGHMGEAGGRCACRAARTAGGLQLGRAVPGEPGLLTAWLPTSCSQSLCTRSVLFHGRLIGPRPCQRIQCGHQRCSGLCRTAVLANPQPSGFLCKSLQFRLYVGLVSADS